MYEEHPTKIIRCDANALEGHRFDPETPIEETVRIHDHGSKVYVH